MWWCDAGAEKKNGGGSGERRKRLGLGGPRFLLYYESADGPLRYHLLAAWA